MAPSRSTVEEAMAKAEDARFLAQYYPDEGTQWLESLHPAIPPTGLPFLEEEVMWKDRQGKVWRIPEMDDNHIDNSMRMMIRNAFSIHMNETYRMARHGDDPILGPKGDGANDAFDDAFDGLMKMDPTRWVTRHYPPYRAMAAERKVRRLKQMQNRQDRSPHPIFAEVLAKHPLKPEVPSEQVQLGQIAHKLMEAVAENVYMHVCSDCGGTAAWADEAAKFFVRYLAFDEEYHQSVIVVDVD